jgi:hypothetical protein
VLIKKYAINLIATMDLHEENYEILTPEEVDYYDLIDTDVDLDVSDASESKTILD